MADFLISSIESQLLQKIITKLEWKSYFRLQQTCKQMEEMIRTNKNIKGIRIDMSVQFDSEMESYFIDEDCGDDADTDTIYGVCWKEFYIEIFGDDDEFDFLDLLEENRITCKKLEFRRRSTRKMNKKQYIRMLRILQPEIIDSDYSGGDSVQINANVKSSRAVEMHVEFKNPQKFRENISTLISRYPRVKLAMIFQELSQEEIFNLVSKVLQDIHSQPRPEFERLEFGFSSRQDVAGLSSTDYLHDLLRNYKLNVVAVPNLATTEYKIEIGNHNYKGHTDVEFSTAVFDLKEMNMKCQIERKRLHYLPNNTITGCNVTVNIQCLL